MYSLMFLPQSCAVIQHKITCTLCRCSNVEQLPLPLFLMQGDWSSINPPHSFLQTPYSGHFVAGVPLTALISSQVHVKHSVDVGTTIIRNKQAHHTCILLNHPPNGYCKKTCSGNPFSYWPSEENPVFTIGVFSLNNADYRKSTQDQSERLCTLQSLR